WALRANRVDLLRRVVHVVASLSDAGGHLTFEATKNYERRTVPIPPQLVEPLAAHLVGREGADLVFPSEAGTPMDHGNWYARRYNPAVERLGLPEATKFHSLRHTTATILASSGLSEHDTMRVLGHGSTIPTYRHLWDDGGERVRDALEAT